MIEKKDLKRLSDILWEIPKSYRGDMRVPARIYASEDILERVFGDRSLEQLVNVTTLPGIQEKALVMPDVHEGYAFPIGAVAATSLKEGVISPGGIGYDINCGVRLLISSQKESEVKSYIEKLGKALYMEIPSGVGRGGSITLNEKNFSSVLRNGVRWAQEEAYAEKEDLEKTESGGRLEDADPDSVSQLAKKRGKDQLGTMGAGNHFVEVGVIDEIFDEKTAKRFGLFKGQVTVLIHTGSRGLGHQVATDYIRLMLSTLEKYKITLPDRELACAPFSSYEGQSYFRAMAASANFAWCNRQLITFEVRRVWKKLFGHENRLTVLYDVAHNIAKIEEHETLGRKMKLIVHRKGATRAFVDQPVIIPGSMGTASYVLIGEKGSMRESFGSTCHGAGRVMSRRQAKREINGARLHQELLQKGIHIYTGSIRDLSEEAPRAYKDIDKVVDVVDRAGIAKKVARLRPIIVVKG